jgi:hypothetical protein
MSYVTVTIPGHAVAAARDFLQAKAAYKVQGEAFLALDHSPSSLADTEAVCDAHEAAHKALMSAAHMFALACATEIAAATDADASGVSA